jgi:ketosteroid isomerase-like protein
MRLRSEPIRTSSANLEFVRSFSAAHERGDFSSAEWAHPEIEFVIVGGPEPVRRMGIAQMEESWRGWVSAWEDYRVEADEYRELDDERVLVLTRSSAYGKAGGLVVGRMRAKGAVLYHLSAGKVTRLVYYWDRDRALAELGLEGEADW